MEYSHFNPLPPHGGRPAEGAHGYGCRHFNPLPPHGGRPPGRSAIPQSEVFQSTPSAWRETYIDGLKWEQVNISIHSLRMEGDCLADIRKIHCAKISIHSLRMEGDRGLLYLLRLRHAISIHSLRMEGDIPATPSSYLSCISIHSLRMEGDVSRLQYGRGGDSISIHSLRMEGDYTLHEIGYGSGISIHSLRMEGDTLRHWNSFPPNTFQSTPSAWRETGEKSHGNMMRQISIHSLRMEGDKRQPDLVPLVLYFNPLPPHGGRRDSQDLTFSSAKFQSTPSAWRET